MHTSHPTDEASTKKENASQSAHQPEGEEYPQKQKSASQSAQQPTPRDQCEDKAQKQWYETGCQDLRLRVLGILQTLFPVLGHTSPATPLCMPPYWSTLGPSFCGAHTECILRLVRPVPRATTRLGTSLVGLLLGHLANDILLHTSLARELTITRNMRLSTRNTRLRDLHTHQAERRRE